MARLDEVFGEDGWTPEYKITEQGVICTLTCTYDSEDGKHTIIKSDGAEYTEKASPLKGGISGALKRAASCLGIGRYLYELPFVYVDVDEKGRFYGTVTLPDAFLPESERTGNTEVKIEYSKRTSYSKSEETAESDKPMTDEVKEAMECVVHGDQYNDGKKLGQIRSTKSLWFISKKNSDPLIRANAAIVLDYRGGFNN